ncbi:MAG TPA: ribosome maturation factor RimM [Pseudonocardiaceae bacterium]|nr:ribosome maturation factor RimM [Pseudonocardiaceae bacterium]
MRPAGPADTHRLVGRVGRPHGVRGEVGVTVRTDAPDQRFTVGAQLAAGTGRVLTVSSVRPHAGRLLVRFEGVDDRAAAEALRGTLLTVDVRTLAPIEDPDEFHDHELEGLLVVDTAGAELGAVREVLHTPGGDLLVVASGPETGGPDTGPGDVLVPFVREIVPEVDLAARRVVLEPPEGLFEAHDPDRHRAD